MGLRIGIGNLNIAKGKRGGIVPQYKAILDYMTAQSMTLPSSAVQKSQNKLVKTLVDAGIWAKKDIFYMFAQPTNAHGEALINWKNPGTYNASLAFGSGGQNPAFTAFEGFQGHIANKSYIRTNYNPFSNGIKFTEQNHHAGIGLATNSVVDTFDYGMYDTTASKGVSCNISVAGTTGYFYDYGQYKGILRSSTIGHWYQSREDAILAIYKDKVKAESSAATSQTISSGEVFILCRNRVGIGASNYSDKQARWFGMGAYLTMAEIAIETDAIEEYLYSVGTNLYAYAPKNDLVLTTKAATAIRFDISGYTGASPIVIDWGDGTNTGIPLGVDVPGAGTDITHTYSTAVSHAITISHANSIKDLRFGYNATSNIQVDVSVFNKCANLNQLYIAVAENGFTGSITGLTKNLKILQIYCTGYISGDVTDFVNLTKLHTNDGLTGDFSNAVNMQYIQTGSDTSIQITADISNMMDLIVIDSYAPNSWFGGDITDHIAMVQICCGATPNEFYGDISTCPEWAYLDNYGNSHMHGDISALNHLYRFRSYNCSNAFTGSISLLPLLQEFVIANDNSTITKPTTIDANPILSYFIIDTATFTASEVNQILADKWADRNAAGYTMASRSIDLSTNGSAAPTGQGLIDKAALQAYRSPNPPGTDALWTIITN